MCQAEVSVRQDEGSPKLLSSYSPSDRQYSGGYGYLTDGTTVLLSTRAASLETMRTGALNLTLGVGYASKSAASPVDGVAVEHVIMAPFGSDSVVLSIVTVSELHGAARSALKWVEQWSGLPQSLTRVAARAAPVATARHA